MRRSDIDEALAALYLRLNGYFTTALILHSPTWDQSQTEIDCLTIRHPNHSQAERTVGPADFLNDSTGTTDLILCEVRDDPNQLRFNNPELRSSQGLVDEGCESRQSRRAEKARWHVRCGDRRRGCTERVRDWYLIAISQGSAPAKDALAQLAHSQAITPPSADYETSSSRINALLPLLRPLAVAVRHRAEPVKSICPFTGLGCAHRYYSLLFLISAFPALGFS